MRTPGGAVVQLFLMGALERDEVVIKGQNEATFNRFWGGKIHISPAVII